MLLANSAGDTEMSSLKELLKNEIPATDLRPKKGYAEIFAGYKKTAAEKVKQMMSEEGAN